MEWLHPLIALTLCCGAVTALLPQGGLKNTAALVMGLLLTLCWAECLAALLDWPLLPETVDTMLCKTGFDCDTALASYAESLGGE